MGSTFTVCINRTKLIKIRSYDASKSLPKTDIGRLYVYMCAYVCLRVCVITIHLYVRV